MKDVLHDKGYESGSCWHKAKVLVLTSAACLCLHFFYYYLLFLILVLLSLKSILGKPVHFKDTVYLQGSIVWKKNFKAKFKNTSLASFSKKKHVSKS